MSITEAAPTGPPTREAQERALAKALVLVSDQHPAWTRHDLLKHLALALPPETRQMSPEEAQELLLGLAEEALSGRTGEVVCLEAPEWPPLPQRPAVVRERQFVRFGGFGWFFLTLPRAGD